MHATKNPEELFICRAVRARVT